MREHLTHHRPGDTAAMFSPLNHSDCDIFRSLSGSISGEKRVIVPV